jgi:hypothetical protein
MLAIEKPLRGQLYLKFRLPMVTDQREFAVAGALATYGVADHV